MKDIQEILIDNLIALRKARGLTQIELGEQVNYSDKTISKWENADSCPSIEAVHRLSVFYGVKVDDLLREDFCPTDGGEEKTAQPASHTYRRAVIALLSGLLCWLLATLLFIVGHTCHMHAPWLFFVDAIPATAIVLLVFNTLWGRRRLNYLIITVLTWAVLTSLFLHIGQSGMWVIYLLGIPAQIGIILWSLLRKEKQG